MAKPAVEIGETFRKPDSPSIVWIVDRFKLTIGLEHVELTRLDDPSGRSSYEPTTRITVSVDTLTNSRFFVRSAAEPG